jgi:flagellar biosynthesis protein FlhG
VPDAQDPAPNAAAPSSAGRAFQGTELKRTGQRTKRVIAVSGSKGGAGKTVLTVNLGIYLSTLGRTTLVVDADRSGAHLHTLIGVPPVLPSQVAFQPVLPPLKIEPTSVPGLFFLNGGVAEGNAGQARPRTRKELFDALPAIDCDYVVLDLGAGIEPELVDAFLAADVALYVTVPEPAAVEGTYRFVRAWYLRRLLALAEGAERRQELSGLADELGGLPVPRELAEALEVDEHPLAGEARRTLAQPLHFVVNQARVRADLELGESMRSAAWQRLGVQLDYLGYVDYDDTVWACVRERQPLLVKNPGTKASKNIEKLARRVVALESGKAPARMQRSVPAGTHHDLLEVERGATDEEIRRAYRRVRDVYAEHALCSYGLFTDSELASIRARSEEAFDVLLDRARRRPYELSVFPAETSPVAEEAADEAQGRELPPAPEITPDTEFDGALLKAMREARGLDLKQIAKRTKISLQYLEALEDDDFGALPALVYVRGFVSELAKCLALDPAHVSHSYVRRVRRNLGEGQA